MPQTLYEYGGSGTLMHMALANGFPPQTYQPLLQPLTERYRIVSLPPRPLWTDPPPPSSISSWRSVADDLLAGMRHYQFNNVIAVGHSFGAIGSMVAATLEPERFRGLVLLDPTLFTPSRLRMIAIVRALGLGVRIPLAQKALNRRTRFATVDEAYHYWRGKRLFHDWSDEGVRLYAESLTRPALDGKGLDLTWSPEWEARYYVTIMTSTWRYLRKLPKTIPLLVVRGTETDAFVADAAARLRKLLPHAQYAEIQGHGHLFPMAVPDQTRAIIESWLPP